MGILGWTFFWVGLSFALYIFVAWRARVSDVKGFYVAGMGVPPVFNGMATAADWMSAASFISMAGLISFLGYPGCLLPDGLDRRLRAAGPAAGPVSA